MTARCAICVDFTLKAQEHKALGLYRCPHWPSWQYPNPFCDRECKQFTAVPPEDMAARQAFERSEGQA